MKKHLILGAALLITSIFIACKDNYSGYDFSDDKIINLDAPTVKAKAYPGTNILVWNAVKNADKYAVYRKDESGLSVELSANQTNLYFVDSDILINNAT